MNFDYDLTPPAREAIKTKENASVTNQTLDRDQTHNETLIEAENLVEHLLFYKQNHSRAILVGTCILLTAKDGGGQPYLSHTVVRDVCKNILISPADLVEKSSKIVRLNILYNSLLKLVLPLCRFPSLTDLMYAELYHSEAVALVSSKFWTYEGLAAIILSKNSLEIDVDQVVVDTIMKNPYDKSNTSLVATYLRTVSNLHRFDANFDMSEALKIMKQHNWPSYIIRMAVCAWAIEYRNENVFVHEVMKQNLSPETSSESSQSDVQ